MWRGIKKELKETGRRDLCATLTAAPNDITVIFCFGTLRKKFNYFYMTKVFH